MGAFLYETARVADAPDNFMGGALGLTVAHLATGPHLYVTSRAESGMTLFDLSPGGTLDKVMQVGAAGARHLSGAGETTWVTLPDREYIVVTSFYDNAVQGYSLSSSGRFTSDDVLFDDVEYDPTDGSDGFRDGGAETALFGADSIEQYRVGGVAHLLVGGSYDGGVTLVRYHEFGVIEHVANLFDAPDTHLAGIDDMALVENGAGRFLIGVSSAEKGASVFRVTDEGAFENLFNLASGEDVGFGRLTRVETADVGGQTLVFTAGIGNTPLHVFRLEANGALTLIDSVSGTEAENIRKPYALRVFEAEGKDFLAVGGDTGGLSVFRIGAAGAVDLVMEQGTERPSRTDPTREIIVEHFGDKTYLITAGQQGDGVTVHRFFTDAKGAETVGGEGDDRLIGKFKGDILIGGAGDDVIKGKSGRDRILDGDGKDQVWGGPGADVFEFADDDKQDKLRDFQDGLDVIDLSADAGIEDMGGLALSQVSDSTVLLSIGEEKLFIQASGGADLSVADFSDADFIF